jgi:hypothetical protein
MLHRIPSSNDWSEIFGICAFSILTLFIASLTGFQFERAQYAIVSSAFAAISALFWLASAIYPYFVEAEGRLLAGGMTNAVAAIFTAEAALFAALSL